MNRSDGHVAPTEAPAEGSGGTSPPGAPGPPPPGLRANAARAGLASLLSRLSGVLREVVLAATFGATNAADALYVALRVPNLLRELLVDGTLVNVSVPLFSDAEAREGRDAMWALANALLGALLVILGVVTLLFLVAARPIVLALAAGFAADPEKLDLTVLLARLLSPMLAGMSIASLFSAMLNVRGRFFLPAIAPATINVATVIAALLADRFEAWTGLPGIAAVAASSTVAGALTAAVQWPALRREGFRLRPHLAGHPALGRALRFSSAALISISAVQLNLLIETQLASRAGDGAVTTLIRGFYLVMLPLSVVAGSVAMAALAGVSRHLSRGEEGAARDALSKAIQLNVFLVAPMAVGLGLLAEPLVRLFFERGAFTPADTLATADVLRMYAVASLAICLHRVLVPIFFALGDPYLPMRVAVGLLLAKLPISLALMGPAGMGLSGLALSHAILVSLEILILGAALSIRMKGFAPGFWTSISKVALASAGMAVAVAVGRTLGPLQGDLGTLALCAGSAAIYAALVLALRVEETDFVLARLLRRRGPPPGAPGPRPGPGR